ncbi:MAG: Imm51 family immunity protein [Bacteroidota bacterium]
MRKITQKFIIINVIIVISFFLIFSCTERTSNNNKLMTSKNNKLVDALENVTIKPRGELVEISSTNFRLDYYDVSEKDTHVKFLEAHDYQGGGPSWLGIIYGAVKMSDPSLLDRIRFDDEADGIAIWSSEKEILMKIGRLISVVKRDEKILIEAIRIAEEDGQME